MPIPACRARKGAGPPLVMLTADDAPTALAAEAAGVDVLLVGDSLGMVELGHPSTLQVTRAAMLHHAAAVGRCRREALLVADMPWLSYHLGSRQAVRNAARFVRDAGADAVKIEGGRKRVDVLHALIDAEIPVMGHLGLTPQSVLPLGGYRVQGRAPEEADRLLEDAQAIVEAGVFGLVLEAIPPDLAARVTAAVSVPTIGIGAGPRCDGQVLVIHDLLGMLPGAAPKFVRQYADVHGLSKDAIRRWAEDVRSGSFPSSDETY